MTGKKVLIVGGVAGGMSAATRARRLSEDSTIIVFEKGPYISFANCGLPYHVGGEIKSREKLILQTPEKIKTSFNIDVRTRHQVLALDREGKMLRVKNLESGEEYEESYDEVILSPGAAPLRPPIPGIDKDGIFSLRNIPDMDRIIKWIEDHDAKKSVVVGGGYIGLEMAEQLRHRGLEVSLIELQDQVMAPLDPEMAALLHKDMEKAGIDLKLGEKVVAFQDNPNQSAIDVCLDSGGTLQADIVILGLGVKPDIEFLENAGIKNGERGGLAANEKMQTNDPHIYAVGDATEVTFRPLDQQALVPLAGPANRQGRVAADNIFGLESSFPGVNGTAILRCFSLTAACTGANEKQLTSAGKAYEAIHLHPANHVGYYPGGKPIALKVLFDPESGKLLGAQAVGEDGIDKRLDVIATAIHFGGTIEDLVHLELCYAPPYGAAKDPVNLAGMIGENIRRGLTKVAQWHEVPAQGFPEASDTVVLDVREPAERQQAHIPNSLHIPLGELRARLSEVPKKKDIIVHCASGQRSNNALRVLLQAGYQARNLTGSMKTWLAVHQ